MGIHIKSLDIEVTGNVVRKFDGGVTRLTVTESQLRELHASAGLALDFFDAQADDNPTVAAKLNTPPDIKAVQTSAPLAIGDTVPKEAIS